MCNQSLPVISPCDQSGFQKFQASRKTDLVDDFMGRENGFTSLRLLAALLVLVTHSYVLAAAAPDPVARLTGLLPASTLGVDMFFAISGFLICASLKRQPTFSKFLQHRMLRILPALAVTCLITVFVVGPLLTASDHYWSDQGTYAYLWNATIYVWRPYLPGVFTQNLTPVVNGSLWTLAMEATCYLILLLFAWCGALNARSLAVLIISTYLMHLFNVFPKGLIFFGYNGGLELYHLNRFLLLFAGGAFISVIGRPWAIAWPVTVASGTLVTAGFALGQLDWRYFPPLYLLAWPWFIVSLAYRLKRLSPLDRFDVSYGIYLYSFLVQQILFDLSYQTLGPKMLTALTLPLTLLLAAASWFWIEKPALSWKERAPKALKAPRPQVAV
jgi:peptidoglycan/LPS O-acetylase OafA/YrhL